MGEPGRRPAAGADRARLVLAPALAVVLLLAGCSSIPTSGPVVTGPPLGQEAGSGLRFQPAGPAPGASPIAIARTFLLAASGVEEDHEVARAYLTPRAGAAWRPGSGTLVYERESLRLGAAAGGRALAEDERPEPARERVTVTLDMTVAATVDSDGRYQAQPPGTARQIRLELRLVGGQWRIDGLPDLLVIDDAGFDLAFSDYQLYFVDPTTTFLVPETRWFPSRRSVLTTLTTQLLAGPSDWLAGAVRTGFPAGVQLTPPAAVTVEDGEARVDLTGPALAASAESRALMQAQLQATLRPVPGITTVQITVDSGDLVLPGPAPVLVQAPSVDPAPVMVAGDRLVELRDGALTVVENLPALDGLGISNPGKGGASFAVLAEQRSQLLHLVPGAKTAPEPLLVGADLTAPSFDPQSWIWSTTAQCAGVVTAARPGGQAAEVDAPWLAGRRILSLRISRDGTRALVVSTGGGGARLDLAGIRRSRDGRPVSLVPALEPSATPALVDVRDAVWTGESGVAVLGRRASDREPLVSLTQPPGVVDTVETAVPAEAETLDVAAGAGEGTLLVGTADGRLWQRAGMQWVEVPVDEPVMDAAYAG